MALHCLALLHALAVLIPILATPTREVRQVKTCPGFPGYCSESYPGDTCLVVCAFGRNNVPECQEDGTWTDIPRCIEHEPGIQEQVPGICPGIPGYCSLDYPGGVCEFDCLTGPDIRSSCTPDGTWEPYPTCDGDIRETKDGCDPCPGPFGGDRNRTAEGAGGGGSRNRPQAGGSRSQARPQGGNNRSQARPTGGAARAQGRPSGGNNRNQRPRNQGGNRSNGNNRGGSRPRDTPRSIDGRPQRKKQGGRKQQGGRGQQGGRRQQGGRPQQGRRQQTGGQRANTVKTASKSGSCPGDVLQSCIDVCPGFSPKVFGACVAGCAKRCPNRK